MKKKPPFISVIIPTLNEDVCAPRLIKCLIKQTYKDFEVIVVDGRSRDNTVQLLKKLKSKFAKFQIIVSSRRNVSYQRNLGVRKAKGVFLVFLDADCCINRNYLKKVYLYIKKEHPLLFTTRNITDSKKIIDKLAVAVMNFSYRLLLVTSKPFIPGYNFIVKRDIFLHLGGFNCEIIHGEDHDLTIIAKRQGIKPEFAKTIDLAVSLRRAHNEGYFEAARKALWAYFHTIIKGPITKKIFEYKMGGDQLKKTKLIHN